MEQTKKRYLEHFIPEKYLERYASPKYPWVQYHLTKLYELTKNGKFGGPRGLEIGFGPTIHRMAIMSNVCEEIVGCDYCPRNIDFVNRWFKEAVPIPEFNDMLKFVAQLEGHEDLDKGEAAVRKRLRARVKHIVRCDITDTESVQDLLQYGGDFDCVVMNAVADIAVDTFENYVSCLKRINSILKPGGALILGGWLQGKHYTIGEIKFNCMYLEESTIRQGLEEASFRVDAFDVADGHPKEYSIYCKAGSSYFCVSYKI